MGSKRIVCFIIGAGHSGSTVLDMALGAADNAFSLGEIAVLPELAEKNGHCACGSRVRECDFWEPIIDEFVSRGHNIAGGFEAFDMHYRVREGGTLTRRLSMVSQMVSKPGRDPWIDRNRMVFDAVQQRTGAEVLIDSTKNVVRARVLGRHLKDYDVRYLHLVRDCRAVVASHKKGKVKVMLPGMETPIVKDREVIPPKKAVKNWLKCNLLATALLNGTCRPSAWKLVRFEDLTNRAPDVLADLSKWLGLEAQGGIRQLVEFGTGKHHNIGGNASRFNSSSIRPNPSSWDKKLSQKELSLVQNWAGFLNSAYGYK